MHAVFKQFNCMTRSKITRSVLQVLMSTAGYCLIFTALFFGSIHGWSLFLGVLIFIIVAIWTVIDCLPKEEELISLSSDLTPLLNVFLPRALIGINIGSLSVILLLENINPFTDVLFTSFLLFSIFHICLALCLGLVSERVNLHRKPVRNRLDTWHLAICYTQVTVGS